MRIKLEENKALDDAPAARKLRDCGAAGCKKLAVCAACTAMGRRLW